MMMDLTREKVMEQMEGAERPDNRAEVLEMLPGAMMEVFYNLTLGQLCSLQDRFMKALVHGGIVSDRELRALNVLEHVIVYMRKVGARRCSYYAPEDEQ